MRKASIIIPAFNEAGNLRTLLKNLDSLPPAQYEILAVDDGSTDGTAEILANHKRVKLLRNERNEGKGRAIMLGCKKAGTGIMVVMDADNSHDPREIPRMVRTLEKQNAGLVIGSRYLGGSADHTPLRATLNNILSLFFSLVFRSRVTDVMNGFKAFRKDICRNMRSRGFEIEVELAAKCLKAGYQIVELPAYEEKRGWGRSKLSLIRDGRKIFAGILLEGVRSINAGR